MKSWVFYSELTQIGTVIIMGILLIYLIIDFKQISRKNRRFWLFTSTVFLLLANFICLSSSRTSLIREIRNGVLVKPSELDSNSHKNYFAANEKVEIINSKFLVNRIIQIVVYGISTSFYVLFFIYCNSITYKTFSLILAVSFFGVLLSSILAINYVNNFSMIG